MHATTTERARLVDRAIGEAFAGRPLSSHDEIARLLEVPPFTSEAARLQAAARRLSEMASGGRAEIHAQVAVNVGPCPRNCLFCSFARTHGLFPKNQEVPLEYVIEQARQFEIDGANAVYLMATGSYPFGRFLERGAEVRRRLHPATLLIANVGDFDPKLGRQLVNAGFAGIYHAARLGEGIVTRIPLERRLRTLRAAREAGLLIGTCLEPVGPEHTSEELTEKLAITREVQPVFSGAARRITIPGTALARHGMVTEARMAHILAVVRVVMPLSVTGNCTHEPNVLGAFAGANLFWAEAGANPRDTRERTEEGRGTTVARCRELFQEADWGCLDGASRFYTQRLAA